MLGDNYVSCFLTSPVVFPFLMNHTSLLSHLLRFGNSWFVDLLSNWYREFLAQLLSYFSGIVASNRLRSRFLAGSTSFTSCALMFAVTFGEQLEHWHLCESGFAYSIASCDKVDLFAPSIVISWSDAQSDTSRFLRSTEISTSLSVVIWRKAGLTWPFLQWGLGRIRSHQ